MSDNRDEIIRSYMAELGSRKTKAKKASSRANIAKALEARRAPEAQLKAAAEAVDRGEISISKAAVTIAKCSYYTLKRYINAQT